MRIGIDVDHTITELPTLFQILSKALLQEKHQVHIITYRDEQDRKQTEEELTDYGIAYTALHMPPPDAHQAKWKAEMAGKLELDVLFDDSPEVLAALPQTCKRIWICDTIFNLDVCIAALRNHRKLPVVS